MSFRSAVFQRLSSMVRERLRAAGVSEEDVLADFEAPDVLVVDADVLLSALIGGRVADALAELGPGHVRAADEVREEVRRWLPELAAKQGHPPLAEQASPGEIYPDRGGPADITSSGRTTSNKLGGRGERRVPERSGPSPASRHRS